MSKYVYFFGDGKAEGRADMKELLGGKGANLAEMTNASSSRHNAKRSVRFRFDSNSA